MVACTNITELVLHELLQIEQYFYTGCVNMQKYDHISWIDPHITWISRVVIYDTFQIGIKVVVFAKILYQ